MVNRKLFVSALLGVSAVLAFTVIGACGDGPTGYGGPLRATTVDTQLRDFSFFYNQTAATSGNIAFDLSNIGAQEHELVIYKIPGKYEADPPLEEFVQMKLAGQEPGEFVGSIIVPAGGRDRLVLENQLEDGRYGVFCFLPDADNPGGPSHAELGMISEFLVGQPLKGPTNLSY